VDPKLLPAVFALLAAAVTPAAAQPSSGFADPHGLFVSFSGGIVDPLHGDLEFRAPILSGAFQFPVSKHAALEVEFAQWRHGTVEERRGIILRDPDGPIGTAGLLRIEDSLTARSLGFKALVRSPGDVRVFGGGGLGIFWHDTLYALTFENCNVPSRPSSCDPTRLVRTRGPDAGLEGIAGIEIVVARRWVAFGAARGDFRSLSDVSSSTIGGVAGVRFSLR
jgi:hypothetical protein